MDHDPYVQGQGRAGGRAYCLCRGTDSRDGCDPDLHPDLDLYLFVDPEKGQCLRPVPVAPPALYIITECSGSGKGSCPYCRSHRVLTVKGGRYNRYRTNCSHLAYSPFSGRKGQSLPPRQGSTDCISDYWFQNQQPCSGQNGSVGSKRHSNWSGSSCCSIPP